MKNIINKESNDNCNWYHKYYYLIYVNLVKLEILLLSKIFEMIYNLGRKGVVNFMKFRPRAFHCSGTRVLCLHWQN